MCSLLRFWVLRAAGQVENLTENYVGSIFGNYDYYVVLSHFKGHAMAGYGGVYDEFDFIESAAHHIQRRIGKNRACRTEKT